MDGAMSKAPLRDEKVGPNSARPLRIVALALSVAVEIHWSPPRPNVRDSVTAHNRGSRTSNNDSARNFSRMVATTASLSCCTPSALLLHYYVGKANLIRPGP